MTIRSHKPIVWGLFAGGGTVAAFLAPVLMVVTGFMPLVFDDVLSYERMQAFVGNWLIKLILLGVITMLIWHCAHRLRVTVHDFGLRADLAVAVAVYGFAGLITLLTIVFLVQI